MNGYTATLNVTPNNIYFAFLFMRAIRCFNFLNLSEPYSINLN
jgi:hypothetical protein